MSNPTDIRVRLLLLLVALFGVILAGCGGGGGGGTDNGGGTVIAPAIVTQPQSVTVSDGEDATFTVGATGTSPAYRWQRLNNGTWANVSGGTAATLTIADAEADDAGSYRVIVSNSEGTVTSDAATLTVNATSETGGGTVIVD